MRDSSRGVTATFALIASQGRDPAGLQAALGARRWLAAAGGPQARLVQDEERRRGVPVRQRPARHVLHQRQHARVLTRDLRRSPGSLQRVR